MTTKPDETYYVSVPDTENPGEWISTARPLGVVRSEAKRRLRQERKALVATVQNPVGNGETVSDTVALLTRLMATFLAGANASAGFSDAKDILEDEGSSGEALIGSMVDSEEVVTREKELLVELAALEDVPAIETWEKLPRGWPLPAA